jgi:transcriptional regulator with XRE-family HTH domain
MHTVNTTAPFEINDSQLKKLAKNLRMLLNEHQVTEGEIAQSLAIPVMTVRRLVSGETTDPRISTVKLMADYFNVSIDSLIEDNTSNSISLMNKSMPQFVPILDWDTAARIKSIKEIDTKSWKEWYPIILGDQALLGNDAFALESRPSMQPRFPIGTLFIIDPNEMPMDGDIILIKMKTSGELSLRELIIDLPRWQLQPVIAGSDMLFYDNSQHHIAGVVVLTILYTRKNKKTG